MSQQNSADAYARHGKQLASKVKQLRGWVSTDPSKAGELIDALNALVAHRLVTWANAEAAADVQEGVVGSARLMSAHGPLGAYTPASDSARFLVASTHLGTVQSRLGVPDAAAATLASAMDLATQLPASPLPLIDDRTALWALGVRAAGALATGEIERANAFADAALQRLEGARLDELERPAVTIDVLLAASDARWAGGRREDAVRHALGALAVWRAWAGSAVDQSQSLSEGHAGRLAGPLPAVIRDAADRLRTVGRVEEGLSVRREGADALGRLGARLGAAVQAEQARALADLGDDLVAAGRAAEGVAASEEALVIARRLAGRAKSRAVGGPAVVAVVPAWGAALVAVGRASEAVEGLEDALGAVAQEGRPTERSALAGYARVIAAYAAAQRAEGADAEAVEATDAELADVLGELFPGRRGTLWDARTVARGAVGSGERILSGWEALDDASALRVPSGVEYAEGRRQREEESRRLAQAREEEARRVTVERIEAARLAAAEAERVEAERLAAEEAARVEAERVAAEEAARVEAERVAAEDAARVEAERLAAEEAARVEAERVAAEEAARVEAERVAAEDAARVEAERVAAAEAARVEAERLAAEEAARIEAERVAAEDAARAEAERLAAEEAARAEAERVAAEEAARVESEDQTAAIASVDEDPDLVALADAWRARQAAMASEDKKSIRAAQETVVEVLRRLFEKSPDTHRDELIAELEELSGARRRAGDWLGAWGPSREAKQLSKRR